MHEILKTLDEHSGELIHELTDEVGLTETEAREFLRQASFVGQSPRIAPERLATPDSVRDVLTFMSGDRLARQTGISSRRAWDGLRALVPAVLRATYPESGGRPAA